MNYLAATILGFLFFPSSVSVFSDQTKNWLPFSIILGLLFTGMFFLIGNSSQKAGITVTTLANKLSLVFPVIFSLVYFHENSTTLKYIGLFTAFAAIALTVYKKEIKKTNLLFLILPLAIFFGSGIADSLIKYVQTVKTTPEQVPAFSTLVFAVAFITTLFISVVKGKNDLRPRISTILLGLFLGAANFGSLYFLLNALNSNYLESSLIFAVNNMSIVALSAFLGNIIFAEKLSSTNYGGLALALVSLYFLT